MKERRRYLAEFTLAAAKKLIEQGPTVHEEARNDSSSLLDVERSLGPRDSLT
jgi:hypothetical protein